MGKILEFLGAPIDKLIGAVGGIIDNVHTSGEERDEALSRLAVIRAEFEMAVREADQQLYETQASIIKAEAQSQDWLPRNVRPGIMALFGLLVFFNYGVRPLLGDIPIDLPEQFWWFLSIGFTGYVGARTYETVYSKESQ